VGPAVGLLVTESITATQQRERFLAYARCTEENYYRDCKKMNRIFTHQDYKAMCLVRSDYINKPHMLPA
jgi:hypothetical protein